MKIKAKGELGFFDILIGCLTGYGTYFETDSIITSVLVGVFFAITLMSIKNKIQKYKSD